MVWFAKSIRTESNSLCAKFFLRFSRGENLCGSGWRGFEYGWVGRRRKMLELTLMSFSLNQFSVNYPPTTVSLHSIANGEEIKSWLCARCTVYLFSMRRWIENDGNEKMKKKKSEIKWSWRRQTAAADWTRTTQSGNKEMLRTLSEELCETFQVQSSHDLGYSIFFLSFAFNSIPFYRRRQFYFYFVVCSLSLSLFSIHSIPF